MLQRCAEFVWIPKGQKELCCSTELYHNKSLQTGVRCVPTRHYRPNENCLTAFRWRRQAGFGSLSGKCRCAPWWLFGLLLKKDIFLCFVVSMRHWGTLAWALLGPGSDQRPPERSAQERMLDAEEWLHLERSTFRWDCPERVSATKTRNLLYQAFP